MLEETGQFQIPHLGASTNIIQRYLFWKNAVNLNSVTDHVTVFGVLRN